ncbi:hypothetical protein ACS3SW_04795 [Roseobacteraceae bacterium S113]
MSAPVAATLSGIIALTVAAVPTGMKAGVRIVPRGVVMAPVRARPSVALRVKPVWDMGASRLYGCGSLDVRSYPSKPALESEVLPRRGFPAGPVRSNLVVAHRFGLLACVFKWGEEHG